MSRAPTGLVCKCRRCRWPRVRNEDYCDQCADPCPIHAKATEEETQHG